MGTDENGDIRQRLQVNRDAMYSLDPPFPTRRMNVEVSNICNHKCVFCGYSKSTREKLIINEDFYCRILDEAYALGMREAGLYACGEPFTCKKLAHYIKIAKDKGYSYVYLTTNFALPSEREIRNVIDAGLDSIRISINGGSRETYLAVHGKDDFERVIENIKFLKRYRDEMERPCKIYLSYVVSRNNIREVKSFKAMMGGYADETEFYEVRNIGGIMPEVAQMRDYGEGAAKYGLTPSEKCSRPFNSVNITAEGFLSACCVDFQNNFIVGDLNVMSLRDAWYGEKMSKFRQRFLEGDLQGTLCEICLRDQSAEAVVLDV